MSESDEFYQFENSFFSWEFAQLIAKNEQEYTLKSLITDEVVIIPSGNQRSIPIEMGMLEKLGVIDGQYKHLSILPTYYFFGSGFDGCCNPNYGFQIFPTEQYDFIHSQLTSLLNKAKKHYTHPVDLTYDKDEFIRKEMTALYTVNQLFDALQSYGITIENKKEILISN